MTATLPTNTALNEHDLARLVALDGAHHLHPFTDHAGLAAEGGSRLITHAEGCWLHDARGNRILDGMAGLWCVNVGYGRKELAEVAYRQMLELPFYNTFFKTATVPAVELAAKLSELLPDGFNHVFFANSGSEANDTVLRLVRHYWNLRGQPRRKTIISRWNAYHGSTVAGASLGGMAGMHAQADLPIPGIEHIVQPYWFGEGGDMTPEEFGHHAAHELELKIIELGPENVAAFIGEPIQGAGGVIIPPESYWPEINRICKHYGILLIADEVICGFGRTGEWFGTQSLGIEPDLMPMAKGLSSGYLPISALGLHDSVAELLIEEGGEFNHGFTYSGHPTAAAVALRNIEIIEREGLVARTRDVTGPYLASKLAALADHPLVGEVRSRGLIGAIEICADKDTRRKFEPVGEVGTICRDHFFANNAIMRACGDTMVLSPPLIITEQELDHLMAVTRTCLDLTWEDVKDRR